MQMSRTLCENSPLVKWISLPDASSWFLHHFTPAPCQGQSIKIGFVFEVNLFSEYKPETFCQGGCLQHHLRPPLPAQTWNGISHDRSGSPMRDACQARDPSPRTVFSFFYYQERSGAGVQAALCHSRMYYVSTRTFTLSFCLFSGTASIHFDLC